MSYARLAATMLRYRVASLLLPFFLLAPAFHGRLEGFRWQYAAGLIALFASYLVATCLNDIFDVEIDRINHPHAGDRPLVSGDATPRELYTLASLAAILALSAGVAVGIAGAGLAAASLLLNLAYSVPPARLCARPLAAPVLLAIAYVVLPFGMGLAAAGLAPDSFDARVVASFGVLLMGRMLLKDFRDRRGDATFGKRTFLIAYGKKATLTLVLACIAVGDALLVSVLPPVPLLTVAVEAYFGGVVVQLYRLWRTQDPAAERVAIALGARMGNAVVLTLLGCLLLIEAGAAAAEQAAFVVAFAGVFWGVFAYLSARPQQAIAAYRG
jgi:4-hydroxybenzoate polyprenyltransferase